MVPETLEPSLQLAAAVLSELNMNEDDVAETVRSFRKIHLADLQVMRRAAAAARAAHVVLFAVGVGWKMC